jgi:hypothetical protein
MTAKWVREGTGRYREAIERLELFDCSLWLGSPEGFPLASELQPEEMKKEMDAHFITGGLVSHWLGNTLSAQAGNKALIESSTFFSEHLYSVWTGLPLYPADVPPLPGTGKPHRQMRGVRIFPASHNYVIEDWVIGSLCEWLILHNMPLFVWHTEVQWAALHRFALRYPQLTIILETQTKKILYHTRVLFSLMRECPNIFVETSNFAGTGYIEYAVRELGAGRLIFGSFLPVNDPFVGIGMILDADIQDRDKLRIASQNLRRIVQEVSL